MNELERLQQQMIDYDKATDAVFAGLADRSKYDPVAHRRQQARYAELTRDVDVKLRKLLAVAAAARSLTGLSDTILSLDSFEANRSCPYCEGNYIVTYEANPFVHSEDCPVILLERAVAALGEES